MFLESPSLNRPLVLDLTKGPAEFAKLKKEPSTSQTDLLSLIRGSTVTDFSGSVVVSIKEGVEYSVGITFNVEGAIVSGLRYLHIAKRSGIKVDKSEAMLGSYGPKANSYSTKVSFSVDFLPEPGAGHVPLQ